MGDWTAFNRGKLRRSPPPATTTTHLTEVIVGKAEAWTIGAFSLIDVLPLMIPLCQQALPVPWPRLGDPTGTAARKYGGLKEIGVSSKGLAVLSLWLTAVVYYAERCRHINGPVFRPSLPPPLRTP